MLIAIKIDTKKVKRELFFKGAKTEYMDLTLHDNKEGRDQYGNDGFVVQDVSKEARQRGEKGPIVGNWKEIGGKRSSGANDQPPAQRTERKVY